MHCTALRRVISRDGQFALGWYEAFQGPFFSHSPFSLSRFTQLQLSPTLVPLFSCFFYCNCILAYE
jgi:hypothetical protein